MKIAFNPSTVAALTTPPNNKDITFDLRGRNIFARGVKFQGTDTNTWRDIKINNVSIGSNILDLRNGSNTTLTNINGVVTINSTWRPVVDNLTSDSTTSSLSANQGRVLKSLIDGKSDSGHTHDDRYLRLTGGWMSGDINFGGDNKIYWGRNTDSASISFKNNGDGDADSYMSFVTSDNGNEYFRWSHSSGSTNTEWMALRSDGLRVGGTKVSLEGHSHNNLYYTKTEVNNKLNGKSDTSHTHDDRYLKLTGGIMTGTINKRSGGSTISGRDHAIIRLTYAPGGSSWNPIACVDTETGTWTLGHLSSGDSDTNFHFCFSTNADYNAGNNNGNYVTLRNKVGTIALLSDIPNKNSWNYDDRYYTKAESNAKYITDITTSVNKLTFTKNGSNITRDIRVNNVLSLGRRNPLTERNAISGIYTYGTYSNTDNLAPSSYFETLGFGEGAVGTIEIGGSWISGGKLYWRALRDCCEDWFSWKTILDSSNYSGILDSRYYTESEVNSLLDAKLNRQNLSYGTWNPRGYNLAADYHYNGGDLSISENDGKMYVSIDGLFYQNEGLYRVLDTSDVAGLKSNLTVYLYLSDTDTTWWPLIWGGSSHNNTSDSTGEVYKSHDKLSWLTSSLTLYATRMRTTSVDLNDNRGIFLVTSGGTSPYKGIRLPDLQSNGIGMFSKIGSGDGADEGGIIISADTSVIYNSFDTGWGLSVRDKDINLTDISGDNTIAFGIRQDYRAYSLGGFEKSGSDNSYVLLGGGGHKLESSLNVASASVASKVYGQVGDTGSHELVRCDMNNDQFRIIAGSNGNNNGWAEIATADDGSEPIYVRQYTGVFSSVVRTLTLLDANGYTHFPSYINIGGNENNNSSPDRVWGSNGSDSYLRSYRTSALNVNYASSAGNADTVDGYHSSSFLTKHTREGAYNIDHLTDFVTRDLQPDYEINIEGTKPYNGWGIVTVLKTDNGTAQLVFDGGNNFYFRSSYGTENRYVTSAWKQVAALDSKVADSDKLDGYHENSFLRYRGDTSTDLEATLWSLIGIKLYNNALPDNLTGVYNYGSVISLPGSSSRFEIYASHLSSNGNGLYYRSGWGSDKKSWLKFIDSSNIGSQSVNYANSAGNADTALYLRSLGNLNCQTGRTLNYGDVYSYNTIYGNTGAPTDYTSVIGFGRGIAGTVEIAGGWDNTNLYWRSLRDCCEDWHSWRTVLDSNNYTGFINNYYWANVKISTSSSTTTSPTVSNLTATSSIKMSHILLEHTDEINNSANGGLHLNYRNSGNVSLCYGGGNVGIGNPSPSYKLDVNGLMRASGFHHSSMNSDNYILLAGGGYKSFGGNYDNPIFLGYLNLDHGNDGTVSSSFYCLGYSVSFTYTRGGNYCKISIPDTSYQTFYISAATASVNYSGGGMDTWTGYRRGDGAWWLHCYAYNSNEVRVKGFRLANDTNDSWWGGNPLWSSNGGANRITVCIFGYVTFK